MSIVAQAESIETFLRPPLASGYKLIGAQKDLLWNMLQGDPGISSIELLQRFEAISGSISITVRHLNRLRLSWGVPGRRGRPIGSKCS